MKTASVLIGVLSLLLAAIGGVSAQTPQPAVSLDDLVGKVRIGVVKLSPDSKQVGYVTVRALPREDLYEVALNLVQVTGGAAPIVLANYKLTPAETIARDSGGLNNTIGQFAWSPDGMEFVYTLHSGSQMEIRRRVVDTGLEKTLLSGMQQIEMGKANKALEFTASFAQPGKDLAAGPADKALVIKDGYTFFGPLPNPKVSGKTVVQHWSYQWGGTSAVMVKEDPPAYFNMPVERAAGSFARDTTDTFRSILNEVVSPDGKATAMVEFAQEPPPNSRLTRQILLNRQGEKDARARILVPDGRPGLIALEILGWSTDSTRIYYRGGGPQSYFVNSVDTEGHITKLLNDKSGLYNSPKGVAVGRDMNIAVLVRSTNLTPDELVAVDLKTGKLTTLARPNASFDTKAKPVVRFIPIEIDGDAFGRLYLPPDYQSGKKYPLVFTQYSSYPGFVESVGDEVPVQTLVANGIAVFDMNSFGFNMSSRTGNFQFAINRVARPLAGMEWVIRKLTDEGLIDPQRVGVTGLSYGSEIAIYAYWKSQAFRAVSTAGGSNSSAGGFLGGPVYASQMLTMGLPAQGDARWKEISAGPNARPDLPPLLLQTPEFEGNWNAPNWTELRSAGAQVEWYLYSDEGHVKRYPANKWWVYSRNLDWFRFWLKDEEDPDPAKKEQYARWRAMREKWEAAKKVSVSTRQ